MSAGRWVVLVVSLVAVTLASSAIASPLERAQAPSCAATQVHYEWNRHARGTPWIAAGPGRSRLEGWLYSYDDYLEDAHVNRSEGVVVRAGVEEKIGWFSRRLGGSRLQLSGRRLDGDGTFSQVFRAVWSGARWYPSGLGVPEPGCWQLTLRTSGWLRRIVVQAIEPPLAGTCDATPVENGSVFVVPRRSGLAGGWGWRTPEGGALLYAGGRTPDGGNTKILWRTTRDASFAGGELTVRGTQLDGPGAFHERFRMAGGPAGYWPSIVVVPNAGCWLFTVSLSGSPGGAGILVVRVVDGAPGAGHR